MAKKYRKTRKKQDNKLIVIGLNIIIIIGFIMIFDGIVSIIFQVDESFLFQFGRIVRIILGISLFGIVGFIYISRKNK